MNLIEKAVMEHVRDCACTCEHGANICDPCLRATQTVLLGTMADNPTAAASAAREMTERMAKSPATLRACHEHESCICTCHGSGAMCNDCGEAIVRASVENMKQEAAQRKAIQ